MEKINKLTLVFCKNTYAEPFITKSDNMGNEMMGDKNIIELPGISRVGRNITVKTMFV